ncbi:MAG: class I SAM-dependent methyltransferase [Betaproteobacteria bacterium]|nr:class I SAM-dependent methyltransferase [Betaproteobacteria bacterium]
MNKLVLKPGKEKSLLRRHPWIFSGAVAEVRGNPGVGETVQVCSAQGAFLASAAYSPKSQIRARAWSFREAEVIDQAWLEAKVGAAIAYRRALFPRAPEPHGVRLLHGEADGLPGLVADRYGDTVVMQVASAGAEFWRETLADALLAQTGCARIYERSDLEVRELEGLPSRSGPMRGGEPPEFLEIAEAGPPALRFRVDVESGQKTGFYLDQRDNRALVAREAPGKDVLNCFCYTGSFTVSALAGGATTVLSVDSSAEALRLARENVALNGLDPERTEWLESDVFKALRLLRDRGRSFDLVILDPPKFAPTASHAERAARAYKDINLWGFKLLRPGGTLVTFSCSGGISPDLFQKIVAGAALDAGVEARLTQRLGAAPDHPLLLSFPESEYLKGLVCRIS